MAGAALSPSAGGNLSLLLRLAVLASQSFWKKGHSLDGLEQQKCMLSQFWPEVQNPGVSRAGSFWKFCKRMCSTLSAKLLLDASNPRVSWLVDMSLQPPLPCPLHAGLCLLSSSYKDISHTELSPILIQ